MKSYLCLSILISILFSFFQTNVLAKTIMIHTTGINIASDGKSDNYKWFYQNAASYGKYCKDNNIECSLYINPESKNMSEQSEYDYSLKTQFPDKNVILNKFKQALKNATSTDQIVFSIDNHGINDNTNNPSCISINGLWTPSSVICAKDIEDALKENINNAKVFILAEACYSGAFHKVASKNVCTFTTADTSRIGHVFGFWSSIDKIKEENLNTQLTLTKLKPTLPKFYVFNNIKDAGGIASEFFEAELCKKSKLNTLEQSHFEFENTLQMLFKRIKSFDEKNKSCSISFEDNDAHNVLAISSKTLSQSSFPFLQNIENTLQYLLSCSETRFCQDKLSKLNKLKDLFPGYKALLSELEINIKPKLKNFTDIEYDFINKISISKNQKAKNLLEAKRGENLKKYLDFVSSVTGKINQSEFIKTFNNTKLQFCREERNVNSDDKKHLSLSTDEAGIIINEKRIKDAEECEQNFVLP